MTQNLDWYPEDFPNQEVGGDILSTVEDLQSDAKLAALAAIASERVVAQNTITNQNAEITWSEGYLEFELVGKLNPQTVVIEAPKPSILLSDPLLDFGEVEIGSPIEYKTITIFAANSSLIVKGIFWLDTNSLSLENPSKPILRQLSSDSFADDAQVTIPENDYRFFKIGYAPQAEGNYVRQIYILSDAINAQPTVTVEGETYEGVTVITVQGSAIPSPEPPVPVQPPVIPRPVVDVAEPTPIGEVDRGTRAIVAGGENGFSVVEDRALEEFVFASEIATAGTSLTEERQWLASFGSIHKAFMLGGSKNKRTLQTETGDVYEYYSKSLYRTVDDLDSPTDMMSGAENSFKGFSFGGGSFSGGSSDKIRETDLNANNIIVLGTRLNSARSLHQATEGNFYGCFIFGGGLREANSSATKGFNHVIKSQIDHYDYGTTVYRTLGESLAKDRSFRLGSHSNYQHVYLAGGGGEGSQTSAAYGGIYSAAITKFDKAESILIPFSRTLNLAVDSPCGMGGNKAAFFAAGYHGQGSTSTVRDRGVKKIQKLAPLETNQGEVEFSSILAEELKYYHAAGAIAQTVDYSSGQFTEKNNFS